MRLSTDWMTAAGCLAVVATLVLRVPGVRVVRADDQVEIISVGMRGSAPSCQAGAEEAGPITVGVVIERDPNPDQNSRTIALNNRGYSYRPPGVDPEARSGEHR